MEYIFHKQVQRLQKSNVIYVPFCQGTKLPFVTCDDDTFNDQIWVFVNEEAGKVFLQARMQQNQDVLALMRLENKGLLSFYASLYFLGVNEIVLVEEGRTTKIPLDQVVRLPDYDEDTPETKRPLMNPQMQLTGIYFMQEIHRKKPNNEKPQLRDLEEEMAANLVQTRFMMALQLRDPEKGLVASNMNIPCMKTQNNKTYQPLFTDSREFHQFNKNKKFQPFLVDFVHIENVLSKESDGIVVNPFSTNMVILREKIPVILERFADRAKEVKHG